MFVANRHFFPTTRAFDVPVGWCFHIRKSSTAAFYVNNQTLQLVSRDQPVNEERPTGLWLTKQKQRQHPGRVTCNGGNRRSTAFNRRQQIPVVVDPVA